ncbi:AbrB/MazE/SpoVT family DNA-binding domain-containing protein [Nocardia sp. NPDC050175]|uniref:AbrB/MazE/SpoVT family DNA-binding domain-containing protein n=1 Tax=Nocardia sp. NPDC050175 TaxID=3364317 RepID=UPI00379B4F32
MPRFDRLQFHVLLDRYLDESESLLESAVSPSSDPLRLPELAVSIINDRSRVCGQRVFEAMGWPPGTAVGFGLVGSVITIGSVERSRSLIDRRGHVRLPVERRRQAEIEPGDPVLLVAMPDVDLVGVMGSWLVEQALSSLLAPLRDPQNQRVIPVLGGRNG